MVFGLAVELGTVYGDLTVIDLGVAEVEGAALVGLDGDDVGTAVAPLDAYLKVADGLEAADLAAGPHGGQGGEHADVACVALHEHLGDAGADSEVAVYLERGVAVVEVVVDAAGILIGGVGGGVLECVLKDDVCVVAVEGPCPEVDLPAHRPAGGCVAAQLEGVDGGLEVGAAAADGVERIESHEVGEVAMAGVAADVVG